MDEYKLVTENDSITADILNLIDPKAGRINHDFRPFSKNAIVYIFKHNITGASYIGSSISPLARIQEHGQMVKKPKYSDHPFYSIVAKEGWSAFSSGVLQISTHFLNEFRILKPEFILTELEMRFLTTATVFELLTKEQYFISLYKPSLNKSKEVTSTLVRPSNSKGKTWVSGGVPKRQVILYIESTPSRFNLEVIRYRSISNAGQALNLSREKLKRATVLNQPIFVESMGLHVKFFIESTNPLEVVHTKIELPDILTSNIKSGEIAAIDPEIQKIFGFYNSISCAAAKHGVNRKNISRYINSNKIIQTDLGSFFFYKSP